MTNTPMFPTLTLSWPKAYPLKHHDKCAEVTRKDATYPEELKLPPGEGLQFRLDSGIAFETEVGEAIVAARKKARQKWTYESIVLDRTDEGKDAAEAATLDAMRRGVQFIWNGRLRLPSDRINGTIAIDGPDGTVDVDLVGGVGEPDALVLVNGDDVAAGTDTPRYAGVDVKWHKSFDGTTQAKAWPFSSFSHPLHHQAGTLMHDGYPKLVDCLQLVHYEELLNGLGFGDPQHRAGIIGKELGILWVNLEDKHYLRDLDGAGKRTRVSARAIYDSLVASHTQAIAYETLRGPEQAPLTGPEWKSECAECGWRDICMDELIEANHITLLPGVTPLKARPYYAQGITKISELARLDHRVAYALDAAIDIAALSARARTSGAKASEPLNVVTTAKEAKVLRKVGLTTVGDLRNLDPLTLRFAGSGVKNLGRAIAHARAWQTGKVYRDRGVSHIKVRNPAVVVHNDIEDTGGDCCYMIGNYVVRTSRGRSTSEYVVFVAWEATDEAEARVFGEWWQWITDLRDKTRRGKRGGFVAYHYTDHETRFYRHLAAKHAGKPGVPTRDELEAFLTGNDWQDLHKLLTGDLIWPTKDHTVKTLAQKVGFTWRDDNPSGAASTQWAKVAMEDPDPQVREEARKRLLEYNEDDVRATDALVVHFNRATTQARRPGAAIPAIESLDARFLRRVPLAS